MRKMADCRVWPSEIGCSLTIAGTADEVVAVAAAHAAAAHGHADGPDLREELRRSLTDDRGAGRYGTVMIATVTGDVGALHRASEQWSEERRVPGFLVDEALVSDDGGTIVVAVFFEDRGAYERLAADPEQDRWYREQMAPHLSDVRWIDGTWQRAVQRAAAPRVPSPAPAT